MGPLPWTREIDYPGGVETWVPLFSYLAFLGFLGSVALMVLTGHLGMHHGLSRAVFGFGATYALWSLGCVFLFAATPFGPREFWGTLATVGTFSFPVSSLAITLTLGSLAPRLKRNVALVIGGVALVVIVVALARHRYYPGLSAFAWDGTEVTWGDRMVPWLVFGVNGVGFAVGGWGLLRARTKGSALQKHQVTLVLVQLSAGLVGYVAASVAEVVWDLPRVGMVTLLYPLGLNFYLIWRYRYLRFDLPSLSPEIIDTLGEAVFLLDPRGQVLKANPAATRIFHDRHATEPGGAFRRLFDDPAAVDQAWSQVIASGQGQEFPGLRVGGGHATLFLKPHHDAFGDLSGLVAVVERAEAFEAAASRWGLTNREREVALLLVQGLSVRQMAEASFVSEATIKTHLVHLYRKSGASNRVSFLQKILQNR